MQTPTLLVIQASPRSARSRSRQVASAYIDAWLAARPGARVIKRDLATNPATFVTEPWIEGAFSPDDARTPGTRAALVESDAAIDEIFAATELLVATPIYNFGGPAVLKAWIDQIVRVGRTIAFGPNGLSGLVPSKPVRVIAASGGDFSPTGAYWANNFLEPHLRAVFGLVGLVDLTFVYAPNQNSDEATAAAAVTAATNEARALAA